MRIKYSHIMLFFLYHITFIRIQYSNVYNYLKYLMIVIVGAFLVNRYKYWLRKRYMKMNVLILVMSICIIFSTYLSGNTHNLISSLIYTIGMIETFLLFQYFSVKGELQDTLTIIYRLTVCYIVITDALLLLVPSLVFKYRGFYLVGTKFDVSYLHILWISLTIQQSYLWANKQYLRKFMIILSYLVSFFIITYVDCSTGLVGLVLLVILYNIPSKVKAILYKPCVVLSTLIISDSVLLFFSSILNVPYIKYFIVNVLQTDVTLTGRMNIYNNVWAVIYKKTFWGYGYGSNFEVLMREIHAPNAQNGILDNIISYGVIGTIVLVVLITYSMSKIDTSKIYYPFVTVIYLYILLSSVEITLNIALIILLAIVSASKRKDQKISINVGEDDGEDKRYSSSIQV